MRKTLWSLGYRALIRLLAEVMEEAEVKPGPLAKRLGKPASYVSKVLRGERQVNPEEVVLWIEQCDLKPEQFFIRWIRERRREIDGSRRKSD